MMIDPYAFAYEYDRRGVSGNWAVGERVGLGGPGEPTGEEASAQIVAEFPGLNFRLHCDGDALTVRCERELTAREVDTLGDLVAAVRAAG